LFTEVHIAAGNPLKPFKAGIAPLSIIYFSAIEFKSSVEMPGWI